jgi:hypothetical protein
MANTPAAPVDPNAPSLTMYEYLQQQGVIAPATPMAANTVSGPNAGINASWKPPQWLQDSMAQQYSNPVSGYSPNANYGSTLGRFQFSSTAPVPKTAPVGWGRYPGVDGSPPSAPWLAGQTAPRPVWGNTAVTPTPAQNTVGVRPINPPTTPPPTGGAIPPTPPQPVNLNPEFILPSQTVTGNTTAGQASGLSGYVTETQPNGMAKWVYKATPVAQSYANYYVPPQYVGKPLPIGAFKTLFPNSQGNDWSKVKPPGWGETWRPTKLGG